MFSTTPIMGTFICACTSGQRISSVGQWVHDSSCIAEERMRTIPMRREYWVSHLAKHRRSSPRIVNCNILWSRHDNRSAEAHSLRGTDMNCTQMHRRISWMESVDRMHQLRDVCSCLVSIEPAVSMLYVILCLFERTLCARRLFPAACPQSAHRGHPNRCQR